LIGPLLAGAAAGYAVAVPVGAIAVLVVETGLRRGFRLGVAAAAGAATADGLYATLAAVGGTAVAAGVAPWIVPLRAAAVVVLLLIAARGFLASRVAAAEAGPPLDGRPASTARGVAALYLRLLALTLLNPMTIIYFAALMLALPILDGDPLGRPAFALGAFAASLSWQVLLAAAGALAHRRLPPRFQVWLSFAGNAMIVAFALLIARDLL
jgi:threonine/homoserine/homoserine lactone efflux protein